MVVDYKNQRDIKPYLKAMVVCVLVQMKNMMLAIPRTVQVSKLFAVFQSIDYELIIQGVSWKRSVVGPPFNIGNN